jgi:HEAT repeat protein
MLRTRSWLLPLFVVAPLAWFGSDADSCIRFKKPGGSVPPKLREPSDPKPPPSEPSDPAPAPGEPSDPKPPPTTPGPTTPPSNTPPPTTPNVPTQDGPVQRGKQAQDDTTWETWWELNRIEFFPRRWVAPVVTSENGQRPAGPQHLSGEVVEQKLFPVLRKLVDDKQVFVQEASLITMGRVAATEAQRAEAREILLKKVGHKNHLIARAAALGLAYVADATSIRPIYQIVGDDKAPEDVRAFLALTLTTLKSDMAEGLLKDFALDKKSGFELAAAAYMALGYNGVAPDSNIHEFLIGQYKDEKLRTEFRAEAVESLGRLGQFAPAHATLRRSLQDKEEDVRRSSALALGVLDYRTDAEREIAKIKAPYEAVIGVPLTPAHEEQIRSLETLIPAQRKAMDEDVRDVVKALFEAMSKDSDAFVKRMAAVSLGRIAAQTPAPDAIKHLENTYKKEGSPGLREFLMLSLGIAKSPNAFAYATDGLTGKNQPPTTRSAACITLGILGDAKANEMLKNTVETDAHPYIRGYAALAMGMIGSQASGPVIQQVVKTSRSPITRAYGMLGLALLGTNRGTDDIVAILKTDEVRDGFVASHMVYALGLTKDRRPGTFDTLIAKAQDDSDMYVQAATIAAIGYLATGEFYPERHLMAKGFNYLMNLDLISNYFYKL